MGLELSAIGYRARPSAVNPVGNFRNADDLAGGGVEDAAALGESMSPIDRGSAAPGIRGRREASTRGAVVLLGDEVVERAVDIANPDPSRSTVEGGGDHRVLAGREVPGAGELKRRAADQIDPRG